MRPTPEDVQEFYRPYLAKVKGDNIHDILNFSKLETVKLFESITEEKGNYCYAEGKWTIKTLLQHIVDSEVVFGFRGLWIARNSDGPLLGFDQDKWVAETLKNERSLADTLNAYKQTRNWTINLYEGITEKELLNYGDANGYKIKGLVLPYLIAGHNLHHLEIIKERYL